MMKINGKNKIYDVIFEQEVDAQEKESIHNALKNTILEIEESIPDGVKDEIAVIADNKAIICEVYNNIITIKHLTNKVI